MQTECVRAKKKKLNAKRTFLYFTVIHIDY